MKLLLRLGSSLSSLLQTLQPRERALLALLVALALVYGVFAAWDWSIAAEERAINARSDRIRAEEQLALASDDTAQRALAVQEQRFRDVGFVATTLAIARAEAQSAIRLAAGNAGIQDVMVNPDPTPQGSGNLAIQTVAVEGRFDWQSLLAFCDTIAQSKQSFLISGLSTTGGQTPRFRLVLRSAIASRAAS